MKPTSLDSTSPGVDRANPMKRRGLLLGAGVAGAALVAVKALPVAPAHTVAEAAEPIADTSAGYRLTPHVLRYYETTKV